MGNIPEYGISKVRRNILPGVDIKTNPLQTNAADFGARKAAQVGKLGAVTQNTGEYIQHEINKAVVRDEVNKARTMSREYMNDIVNRKGKDALGSYDEAQKKYEGFSRDAQKNLKLSVQQEAFKVMFGQLRDRDLSQTLAHQTREAYRFKIATLDAENYNELEDAMFAAQSPTATWDDYAENYQAILDNTAEKYRSMGSEVVKSAQQDAQNNFHSKISGVIAKHKSAKAAKEYLNGVRQEISAPVYTALTESFKAQDIEETAHGKALELFDSGKTVEQQLDAARRLPAEIASAVEAKVSRWNKQKDYAREKAETELVKNQVETVNSGLDKRRDTIAGRDVDAMIMQAERDSGAELPSAVKMRLRDYWYKTIEARDEPKKKTALEIERVKTYDELMQKARYAPEKFLNENLAQYYPILGKENYNRLESRKDGILGEFKDTRKKTINDAQKKREKTIDDAVDTVVKFFDKQSPFMKDGTDAEQTAWRDGRIGLESFMRNELKNVPTEKITPELVREIQDTAKLKLEVEIPWSRNEKVPLYVLPYAAKKYKANLSESTLTGESRDFLYNYRGIPKDAFYDIDQQLFVVKGESAVKKYLNARGISQKTFGEKYDVIHVDLFGNVVGKFVTSGE